MMTDGDTDTKDDEKLISFKDIKFTIFSIKHVSQTQNFEFVEREKSTNVALGFRGRKGGSDANDEESFVSLMIVN